MSLLLEWQALPISLTDNQVLIAADLYPFLTRQAARNPLVLHIINKTKLAAFIEQDKIDLQNQVISQFKPLKHAYEALQVLSKIMIGLNAEHDLGLPQLSVPSFAPPSHNPFSSSGPEKSLVECLRLRQQIEQCFSYRLTLETDYLTRLGALITSSIVFGALLHQDLVEALIKDLINRPNCFLKVGEQFAIQLSLAWRGEPASEWRLFYPDALTEVLFLTFPSAGIQVIPTNDQALKPFIWKAVKHFLRNGGLSKDQMPSSLNALIQDSRPVFDLKLLPVLSSYASRTIISHSLKPHVLARMFGGVVKVGLEELTNQTESYPSNKDLLNNVRDLSDVEPIWLCQLRKALHGSDLKVILQNLNACTSQMALEHDFSKAYFYFALFLLKNSSAHGNKLSLETVKMYVMSVARRLGCRLGHLDPITLSVPALEALYLEILEDDAGSQKLGLRRSIARSLREFHHFLNKEYDKPSINANAILGIGRGLMPVDANIMTYDEFHQFEVKLPEVARRQFSHITQQQELVEAAYLIALLGHRCGLRRSEALMLQKIDFCDSVFPEMLIRPTEFRRLKSKSSRRKIPLYALLETSEIDRLRMWINERKKHVDELFIFAIPELGQDVLGQDLIFNLIHQAMRQATGDESLRFHHLRHSFACWTAMRLLLSDLPAITHPFKHMPMTSMVLDQSKDFRKQLYGSLDPTRRSLYAVASLLGHSGPDMSEEHYIHIFDWLLRTFIDQDSSLMPRPQDVMAWTLIAQTTKYKYVQTPENFRALIYKHNYPVWVKSLKPNKSDVSLTSEPLRLLDLTERADIFDLMHTFLFMRFVSEESMEQCLEVVKFQPLQASALVNASTYVFSLITNNGGGAGLRHRAVNVKRNKVSRRGETVPMLREPNFIKDKHVMAQLTPKFIELIRTQRSQLEKICTFYIENQWKTKKEAIFELGGETSYAKDFYQFLIDLGIPKQDIIFIKYDLKERSAYRSAWKKALGLPNAVFTYKAPPNIENRKCDAWLGIKPVFEVAHGSEKKKGSISVRYLMVMSYLLIQMGCF